MGALLAFDDHQRQADVAVSVSAAVSSCRGALFTVLYFIWAAFVVASIYPKMTRTAYIHAQYSHAQCSHAQYSHERDMVHFVYNVLILMSRVDRNYFGRRLALW